MISVKWKQHRANECCMYIQMRSFLQTSQMKFILQSYWQVHIQVPDFSKGKFATFNSFILGTCRHEQFISRFLKGNFATTSLTGTCRHEHFSSRLLKWKTWITHSNTTTLHMLSPIHSFLKSLILWMFQKYFIGFLYITSIISINRSVLV